MTRVRGTPGRLRGSGAAFKQRGHMVHTHSSSPSQWAEPGVGPPVPPRGPVPSRTACNRLPVSPTHAHCFHGPSPKSNPCLRVSFLGSPNHNTTDDEAGVGAGDTQAPILCVLGASLSLGAVIPHTWLPERVGPVLSPLRPWPPGGWGSDRAAVL